MNISIGAMQNASITEWKEAASPFVPAVSIAWLGVFILTLLLGMIMIRKDLANFWAIFILTQLILAVALFFTFIYPITPIILQDLFS